MQWYYHHKSDANNRTMFVVKYFIIQIIDLLKLRGLTMQSFETFQKHSQFCSILFLCDKVYHKKEVLFGLC